MEKYRFCCDRGSLAMKVNGSTVLIGNGIGDGWYYVTVGEIPTNPKFRIHDFFIDGPATVELMDYDCSGAKTMKTIEVERNKMLLFYRDENGNFAIGTRGNKTSVRAHVQVKQPEYGRFTFSSCARQPAFDFLQEKGVQVYTGDSGADDDKWEIEIPSIDRMNEIIDELRENPHLVEIDGDGKKISYSDDLADLLSEGLESAIANKYDYIVIEWW